MQQGRKKSRNYKKGTKGKVKKKYKINYLTKRNRPTCV